MGLSLTLLIVPVMLPLAACSGSAARQPQPTTTASATSTPSPSASPAASGALPQITPQHGWQAVLTLGEEGSSTSSSASFTANAPYMLFWACEGTGTLKISYGNISQTTACSAQPQLMGSGQQTPNPVGQQVTVSVMGQGNIAWEVLVEMEE